MYSTEIAREPRACDSRFPLTTTSFREPVMPTIDDSVLRRFWLKVKKTDSCWLWIGACTTNPAGLNYGQLWVKNRNYLAHRISWMAHRGEIPEGLLVLHNCPSGDNPSCVNPDHLFLGTYADNYHDMMAKRRYSHPIGCNNGQSKLNDEIVMSILKEIQNGTPEVELAKAYSVNRKTIYDIRAGKNWKHVHKSFTLLLGGDNGGGA